MTNAELFDYVFAKTGMVKNTALAQPLILANANLALRELAYFLIETDSELAKKLITSVANQTWASSSFALPSDFLYHKQKKTTRMDLGGTLAFQVEDRDKLDMSTGLTNHYYAIEGTTMYIKHSAGTVGASNLNLRYYKIPALSAIDAELRDIFLDMVVRRIMPTQPDKK